MVARTGPKVAVPIRWDDSGRPLKDGLKPASFPVDRPGRTRELLRTLACEGHVEFRSLALFEPAELAPPPSSSHRRLVVHRSRRRKQGRTRRPK